MLNLRSEFLFQAVVGLIDASEARRDFVVTTKSPWPDWRRL
jgi:hypothetical protein